MQGNALDELRRLVAYLSQVAGIPIPNPALMAAAASHHQQQQLHGAMTGQSQLQTLPASSPSISAMPRCATTSEGNGISSTRSGSSPNSKFLPRFSIKPEIEDVRVNRIREGISVSPFGSKELSYNTNSLENSPTSKSNSPLTLSPNIAEVKVDENMN